MDDRAKRSVLIVDDDPAIRELVRDVVASVAKDVLVVEADNGSDAWIKAGRQRFDLVVTDLKMPRKDGSKLVEGFASMPPKSRPVHIVVFSAHITPAHRRQPIGNILYIPKPCTADVLRESIECALVPAAAGPGSVDVGFVNPFIEATIEILAITASTAATKDKIFIRSLDQISGDVSAVIAVNGSSYRGSMAISFDIGCFCAIVGRMLGKQVTEPTLEASDAVAELCTQVFEAARRRLNHAGQNVEPAVPSVVTGKRHQIRHFVSGPVIAVRFKTPDGIFTVETAVAERKRDVPTVAS